jgi:adenylosuccinate lyase
MLERAAALVSALVVYPERAKKNLEQAKELYFSEAILLALVHAGMARQEAYVFVQRNAMRAWAGEGTFRQNLLDDADVRARLDEQAIHHAFDLGHALAHVPAIVERALAGK